LRNSHEQRRWGYPGDHVRGVVRPQELDAVEFYQ
jgi:hypothetical protein